MELQRSITNHFKHLPVRNLKRLKEAGRVPTCSASWLFLGGPPFFLLSEGPFSSAACPPLQLSPWGLLAHDDLAERKMTDHEPR